MIIKRNGIQVNKYCLETAYLHIVSMYLWYGIFILNLNLMRAESKRRIHTVNEEEEAGPLICSRDPEL